jgi:2-dehydro-3-deoxyphosphogluconate aldolase/(4S)-4-hydroxy-2-oxoglutarate aldolase
MTGAGPGSTPGFNDRLRGFGIIPVVEIDDADHALALAQALEEGGLPIIEVTFRTDAAADAIRRIARGAPDIYLIAGTITSTRQADVALDSGADMLVSPGLNREVVEHASKIGLPMMPGVCTPSEVEAAMSLGLTAVKLFPIEPIGGLRYLKALAAPYPAMSWNPTGGITLEALAGYLGVKSVLACGGSWVAPRADVAAGRYDAIAARAAAAVDLVRTARASREGMQ